MSRYGYKPDRQKTDWRYFCIKRLMCKCNAYQRTVWYASVCAWLDKDGKALYAALFLYFHIAFTYAITHDSCTFVFTSRWYREGEILPELSWSFIYERSRSIITFPFIDLCVFRFPRRGTAKYLAIVNIRGDVRTPERKITRSIRRKIFSIGNRLQREKYFSPGI